jgi:hypothetical protein
MALGPAHTRAATRTLVIGTVVAAMSVPPPFSIYLFIGLVIGRYCGPDERDQAHVRNDGETLVYQEFGWVIGGLWQAYWWPLAKRIKHRSWRSHFAGPATLIAWLYLWVPIISITWFLGGFPWAWWLFTIASCTFPGWMLQDTVHLAKDNWKFYWTKET